SLRPQSMAVAQPPPQAWLQDPDRPSIVSATELKELDNLDTDTDEGWAGAQMEVDYTEKLNFSDDEENQAAKEKGENWQVSRPPDGQDSSEEHGGKTSWADSADPRAPSPGSAAHYNKAATLQDYQGGSRASSGGAPRGSKPAVAPADEDSEAWRQKRKKSSEVSEAVERARRRREEEERRMEEQRLAACAEKLKRLNEKHRQMTEVQASLPQTACDDAQAPKEEIQSAPDPAAPGTPVTVPAEAAAPAAAHNLPAPHDGPFTETGGAPAAVAAAGTKSPDLSNQNSSDQANEEWETASESSDFNERREREERRGAQEAAGNATATPAPAPLQRSLTPSKSPPEGVVSPKRDGAAAGKRSFSSQRPIERQNRRGNSGAKPGRSYGGPKGDRRGGAKGGRKG
uniref:BAT2 N-terminal domain-containing protein n=1 Tax=Hippocampus comes TaxID=109280 RepID=A0A3Q2YKU4_HIPCM